MAKNSQFDLSHLQADPTSAPQERASRSASNRHRAFSWLRAIVPNQKLSAWSPREKRWAVASGALLATLLTLLLGGISWRSAVMLAGTIYMIAQSADMID